MKKLFSTCFVFYLVCRLFAQADPHAIGYEADVSPHIESASEKHDDISLQYAETLQSDDDIFRLIRVLFLQSTGVCLVDHEPASRAELALYLEQIDPNQLDAATRELYARAYEYIYKKKYLVHDKVFSLDANAQLALQIQYNESKKLLRADKIANYNKTPALIAVPISLNMSQYVNFAGMFELKKGFGAMQESLPFTNMPLKDDAVDVQFPHQANFAFANSFMCFSVARGRYNIGQTLNGSLFTAAASHSLDSFSLRFFHKNFNIASSVYIMERYRYWFTHEINFRITKYAALRFFEGTTEYGSFDIRYLNPMIIFHNLYGWNEGKVNGLTPNGSQLGIGLELVPYKGLRFYAQFEMNQIQTAYEKKHYAEDSAVTPNSLGGLCGIEYAHVFPVGVLTVQNEFLYANPWLNILEHKKISLLDVHTEKVAPPAYLNTAFPIWLTNPLGPDTIAFTTKISFDNFFNYGAAFQYRFIAKGENEDAFFAATNPEDANVYYPSTTNPGLATLKTPSGKPLYVHSISLEAFDEPYKNLRLQAALQFSFFSGRERKTAVFASLSMNYKLGADSF